MDFTCSRVNYNGIGSRYIHSFQDVILLNDKKVLLDCSVRDFFLSIKDLSKISDKDIRYNVMMSESDFCFDNINMFDYFLELDKYIDYMDCLELILVSKINDYDFINFISFLKKIRKEFNLVIKFGSIDILTGRQINILNNVNNNIICKFKINQSYCGLARENNDYDNIYNCNELLDIKKKVSEIVSLIPFYYNEYERILFVYKYLGERIFYDDYIAGLNYEYRNFYDSRSIYDVLFNNKGVCSSISVTFRVIMDFLGIECYTASSVGHEWNVLKLEDSFYKVDLTSDLYNIKYDFLLENFLVFQGDSLDNINEKKKIKK